MSRRPILNVRHDRFILAGIHRRRQPELLRSLNRTPLRCKQPTTMKHASHTAQPATLLLKTAIQVLPAQKSRTILYHRHTCTLPPLQDNEPLQPLFPPAVRLRRLSLIPAPVQGGDLPPHTIVSRGISIIPRAACTFRPGFVDSDSNQPTLEDSSTGSSTSHSNTTPHLFMSPLSSHNIFQPLALRQRP